MLDKVKIILLTTVLVLLFSGCYTQIRIMRPEGGGDSRSDDYYYRYHHAPCSWCTGWHYYHYHPWWLDRDPSWYHGGGEDRSGERIGRRSGLGDIIESISRDPGNTDTGDTDSDDNPDSNNNVNEESDESRPSRRRGF